MITTPSCQPSCIQAHHDNNPLPPTLHAYNHTMIKTPLLPSSIQSLDTNNPPLIHSQTAVKACNRGSVALGGWQLTPAVCRSQRRVSAPASTGAIYFNRGHRERGITTQRANQRRRSRVKLLKKSLYPH